MAIDAARLITMFDGIADAIAADRDRFCALDGKIGDGDHGIAMDLGFSAVRDALRAAEPAVADPTAVLNTAARAFLNAVGASSGPLYATAFMRAAAAVKGRQELEPADIVAMLEAMAKGIRDRGKAEPGEKTMVDAWQPAADAARQDFDKSGALAPALAAAVAAAKQGVEATIPMISAKGRSSRLGDRTVGHADPGAASAATIISAMARALG